jgi:acetyl-CoA acyltransferase
MNDAPFDAYAKIAKKRRPVVAEAVRTPFLDSGGAYADLRNHELGALALRGVLDKTGLAAEHVELVTMGMVVQDVQTTNVAREAMIAAGYPSRIPAYTVSMAGVSPAVGLVHIADMIALGRIDIAVAGGTENFSDIPIRFARNVRQRAVKLGRAKTTAQRLRILAGLRPADIIPEIPTAKDMTTGMDMGESCEAMVRRFGVTRQQADDYAVGSHHAAARAWEDGRYDHDVLAVNAPGGQIVRRDNAIRADTSAAKLARLEPTFDKENGIITAGNATGLTDGATAALVTSAEAAKRHGLNALAQIRDYQMVGVHDMHTEMLLGPALSIPPLLARHGLTMDDIGVFELHEAFAAQILANQKALADNAFARAELGLDKAPGPIPPEKLNCWGGSLALGNPFAGTGGRLLSTAARRLQAEDQRYAVVATCAGGGLGAAILLENPGGGG